MTRFIEGKDRRQTILLPECLDDYVTQDNPVRVIDAFIDELDLLALGFTRAQPAATGRPAYHPAILLKIYLYGYLHRVPSSRRLEQETRRNLELIWLTGRLAPDFKTLAEASKETTGTAHPAILSLQKPQAAGDKLAIREESEKEWVIVRFLGKVKQGADSKDLPVELVVVGKAAE